MTLDVGARQGRRASSPARAARPALPSARKRALDGKDADEFVLALEEVSRGIQDPVAKLRYIRSSLARYQQADRCVRAVPFASLRHLLYRLLSLDGIRHLLTANPMGAAVPVDLGTRRRVRAAGLLAVAAVLLLAVGLVGAGFRLTRASAQAAAPLPPAPPQPAVAEAFAALPEGVAPASVWLVEKGDASEQYSNGLRIDTTYAVRGRAAALPDLRRRPAACRARCYDKPVGHPLPHLGERHLAARRGLQREAARLAARASCATCKRNLRLPLPDRPLRARVPRGGRGVARRTTPGSRSGAASDAVYLNLNNAFLGICFETRWEGGRALPITARPARGGAEPHRLPAPALRDRRRTCA